MTKREIIQIDEDKCVGCGLCIINCAEGAMQIIDGKARLISDNYCDGLGKCIGHCPQGALQVIVREAVAFDENAHEGAKEEGCCSTKEPAKQTSCCSSNEPVEETSCCSTKEPVEETGGCSGGAGEPCCPTLSADDFADEKKVDKAPVTSCGGNKPVEFGQVDNKATFTSDDIEINIKPQLRQWPVQFDLVPTNAPYFKDADLLVTADCVPIAYPNYHLGLLKGKAVVIGCPKQDSGQSYAKKLTEIINNNTIKSITIAFMEVGCCQALVRSVEAGVSQSNKKDIKINKVKIGIQGEIM